MSGITMLSLFLGEHNENEHVQRVHMVNFFSLSRLLSLSSHNMCARICNTFPSFKPHIKLRERGKKIEKNPTQHDSKWQSTLRKLYWLFWLIGFSKTKTEANGCQEVKNEREKSSQLFHFKLQFITS